MKLKQTVKCKWYYVLLPACVSFGPFAMSNMGGLSERDG